MEIIETPMLARAKVLVHQSRPTAFDSETGLWLYEQVGEDEEAWNLITNTGRVQLHTQVYGTAGLLGNGFNYIGLTNDGAAPAPTDSVLPFELTNVGAPGLGRVQGLVTLPTGSGTVTTIVNTFTYTGLTSQAVQKTALFTAVSSGVMNHEIAFTQRTLFTNDTLTLTFSISTS
jgi:hypothetical protein